MADAERTHARIRERLEGTEQAALAACRVVLTKAAIDTVSADRAGDAATKRRLYAKAVDETEEGGRLYRESVKAGVAKEFALGVARACDEEALRLKALLAAVGK